jgi:hypothetical protein
MSALEFDGLMNPKPLVSLKNLTTPSIVLKIKIRKNTSIQTLARVRQDQLQILRGKLLKDVKQQLILTLAC